VRSACGHRARVAEVPAFLREEGRGSANPARSFAPRDLGPRTICSGVMLAICFCANAIISGVIFEGSIVRVRGRSRRPQRSARSRLQESCGRRETRARRRLGVGIENFNPHARVTRGCPRARRVSRRKSRKGNRRAVKIVWDLVRFARLERQKRRRIEVFPPSPRDAAHRSALRAETGTARPRDTARVSSSEPRERETRRAADPRGVAERSPRRVRHVEGTRNARDAMTTSSRPGASTEGAPLLATRFRDETGDVPRRLTARFTPRTRWRARWLP